MAHQFDISTLNWVKGEIDDTLKQARIALEAYVEDPSEKEQLDSCIDYLHQVKGTLQMVELHGAVHFAGEVEALIHILKDVEVDDNDLSFELLMRAILQLPYYLESLQDGYPDNLVSLLPLINEMREVRQEPPLNAAKFFSPDLAIQAPVFDPSAVVGQSLVDTAKDTRRYYQASLLKLLRGEESETCLKVFAAVFHKLMSVAEAESIRRWLWVGGAMIAGMRSQAIPVNRETKALLGRFDSLLKVLIEQGEKNYPAKSLNEAVRGALYQIAIAKPNVKALEEIQQAFQLDKQIPKEISEGAMGGFNAELKQTVAADVLDELVRIKDVLDIYVRGDQTAITSLASMADSLVGITDTLKLLHLEGLSHKLGEQIVELRNMATGVTSVDDDSLMAVAGALLAVELAIKDWGTLAHIEEADDRSGQLSDSEITPEAIAEHRRIIRQVMKESKDDLVQARESVTQFLEDNSNRGGLEQVPERLHRIVGGMTMLSYTRVAQIIRLCSQFIQNEIINSETLPGEAQLDQLADAMMSVDYYLDAFIESKVHPGSALDVAEGALQNLGYSIEPSSSAENQAAELPQHESTTAMLPGAIDDADTVAVSSETESNPVELVELVGSTMSEPLPPESESDTTSISAQGLPPLDITFDEVESTISTVSVEESAPPNNTVVVDIATTAESSANASEELDDEIIEIFVEEAEEEFARIGELLPRWKATPSDQDALTELRRSFHTIKGSGRLVGAKALGEFAWAFENMMNRVIEGTISYSNVMFDILDMAQDIFPELLEEFRSRTPASSDTEMLLEAVEELSRGAGMKPATVAEVPVTPATIEPSGDVRVEENVNHVPDDSAPQVDEESQMDPVLLDIYAKEVADHSASVAGFIARSRAGDGSRVDESLIRALHTLQGSSRMAGVEDVGRLSGALEHYAKTLQAGQHPVDDSGLRILEESMSAIARAVGYLESPRGDRPDLTTEQQQADQLCESVQHIEAGAEVTPESGLAQQHETAVDLANPGTVSEPVAVTYELTDEVSEHEDRFDRKPEGDVSQLPSSPMPESDVHGAESGEMSLDEITLDGLDESLSEITLEGLDESSDATTLDGFDESSDATTLDGFDESTNAITLDGVDESSDAITLDGVDESSDAITLDGFDESSDAITLDGVDESTNEVNLDGLDELRDELTPDAIEESLNGITLEGLADLDETLSEIALDALSEPPAESVGNVTEALELSEVPTSASPVSRDVDAQSAAESSLFILDDIDPDLMEIFLEEGSEILDSSEQTLHDWVANPDDRSLAESLQRQLHTLKGGARMAGVTPIGDLSHILESTFEGVVEGRLQRSKAMTALLQLALDRLVLMLEQVREHQPIVASGDLIDQVAALAKVADAGSSVAAVLPLATEDELVSSSTEAVATDTALRPIQIHRFERGDDYLTKIRTALKAWRKDHENVTLIDELLNNVVNLRNEAERLAFAEIGELSRRIGSELNQVIDGHVAISEKLFSVFDEAVEYIDRQLIHIKSGEDFDAPTMLMLRIDELEAEEAMVAAEDADKAVDEAEALTASNRRQGGRIQHEMVRVRSDVLNNLVNFAGELSIYRARVEQQIGSFRFNIDEMDQTLARLRDQLRTFDIETEAQIESRQQEAASHGYEDFDPLEFDRFTTMQQVSRSMMESLSDLSSIEDMLLSLTREAETLLLQQSRVNTELQENLMQTRMVPLVENAPRLRRIVRQTCAELGKEANISFSGADVKLDRTVVERMMAPLGHMLRNAIAHGIELPQQRKAAGKPEAGHITIALSREGAEVVIRFSDDGMGIDVERVKSKAIEKSLMTADALLGDHEIVQFIMESGLSTAEKLSQVSGRGVGMDVVNSEIKQLGGVMAIESQQGKGSTFTIRLPLTLSVSRALLVNASEEIYAIPLLGVQGIERIATDELQQIMALEQPRFQWVGDDYELLSLSSILGTKSSVTNESTKHPVLLAQSGDQRVALTVDALIGSREIVVKSLGPQLSTLQDLAGATILADGSVALIIDMPSLIRHGLAHRGELLATERKVNIQPVIQHETVVMVVDDSITVRKVTERLLKRNEIKPILAKDGVDALALLDEQLPDVMLLDIEMPRMDGYELATHMRNSERLKHIPIIMITSRTGDKHRQRAMDIGVNVYMGKPFTEGDLLANIDRLLGSRMRKSGEEELTHG